MAVTSTGQLYGFGLNQYGELGGAAITGVSPNPTPALVALPVGETADTVARGPEGLHSLVVTADLTVATGSLADGTVGAPYSQPVQASGGTPPYRWSVRGLPAGLSIDPTTGTISGTPTQTGAFTVDVTLTDSDGIATSRSLSLMIAPRPPIAPTPSSKPVISGLSVSPHALSLSGRLVNGRCRPLRRTYPHNRACRRPLKLRISFTLSAAGSVTISFANISAGRLVKSRCVKPTKANRRHRRCARRTALHGQITRTARHGANTITIIRSTLPPGTYQLTVTPRSGARAGTPETATIIITG